jgi:hypothetical protein
VIIIDERISNKIMAFCYRDRAVLFPYRDRGRYSTVIVVLQKTDI